MNVVLCCDGLQVRQVYYKVFERSFVLKLLPHVDEITNP